MGRRRISSVQAPTLLAGPGSRETLQGQEARLRGHSGGRFWCFGGALGASGGRNVKRDAVQPQRGAPDSATDSVLALVRASAWRRLITRTYWHDQRVCGDKSSGKWCSRRRQEEDHAFPGFAPRVVDGGYPHSSVERS